eukprot:m.92691 g.92691  ORF g.92691 m.92691 type:complete len:432 (-) comp14956_c0_seq1:1824-3119(-)
MEPEAASSFKLKPLVVTFAAGVAAGVSLYSLYRLVQTSTSSPSSPATPEPMDVQTDPTRPMQASEEHSLVEDVASVCLDAPSHAQGGEDADEEWEDLDEVDMELLDNLERILHELKIPGIVVTATDLITFTAGTSTVEQDCFTYVAGAVSPSYPKQAEALTAVLQAQPGVIVNIDVCPSVNDACPDMHLKHMLQGKRVHVAPVLADKVAILTYWASFVQPGLAALCSDASMLATHPEWRDNVVLIPCNVDEDMPTAQAAYINLELPAEGVLPLHLTPSENEASFGVDVLPTVVLLHNGCIVWRGHRDDLELEASVEALLAGGEVVLSDSINGAVGPIDGVLALAELSEDAILELQDFLATRLNSMRGVGIRGLTCAYEDAIRITQQGRRQSRRLVFSGSVPSALTPAVEALQQDVLRQVCGQVAFNVVYES